MSRRAMLAALLLAGAVVTAGCGSTAGQLPGTAGPPRPPSLNTALATADGIWAVVVMGGSAASNNDFWQLFARPAGTTTWRLVTPPGVASNGGLVLASPGTGPVVAGFRPSQKLAYSPLATTGNNGAAWSAGLLDAVLANVPDALAAAPAGGRLLALVSGGTAELSGPGGTAWQRVATTRELGAAGVGGSCRPGSFTAAAFSPSGTPMLAVACGRPGVAGIFAHTGQAWHLAGPALPPGYAHQLVTVLRLATTGAVTTALLAAGTGATAHLLAATSADSGAHWALSPPLRLADGGLTSASFGPAGTATVILASGHAEAIAAATGHWQPLPALPPGTATLAPGATDGWDALAVHQSKLTVWHLAPGGTTWSTIQTMKVPIQYGSSG
jgi:hypothetical protein